MRICALRAFGENYPGSRRYLLYRGHDQTLRDGILCAAYSTRGRSKNRYQRLPQQRSAAIETSLGLTEPVKRESCRNSLHFIVSLQVLPPAR
jgi:hypothetical protein